MVECISVCFLKVELFAHCCFILVGTLDAIYDVTIAYPDNLPEKEIDLFNGQIPTEVHFFVRR